MKIFQDDPNSYQGKIESFAANESISGQSKLRSGQMKSIQANPNLVWNDPGLE